MNVREISGISRPPMSDRARPWLASLAGALIVLAAAIPADEYARHGLSVTWRQAAEGGELVEVARTVEHRTSFPNVHRPLSRYVQNWPFDRLPIPTDLPRLDAIVRARLHVPDGPVFLRARTANRATITVDGAPVPASGVSAGWHRVEVAWTGDLGRAAGLELEWGPSPESTSPIPRDALVPMEGSWPPLRIALWTAALLAMLLLGGWTHRIASSSGELRRARIAALATVLVVGIGVGYRAFDYDVMPEYRENGDELFAMWDGWSILEDGTTRGWSLWSGVYAGTVDIQRIEQFDQEWFVVSPYFEHPPALHLLTGIACQLGGAEHWQEVRLRDGRIVPILLSALTILLIVLVGRRLDPVSPAPWLAALLYATLPVIALQTRVIKEEALVAPLGLATVWLFLRWRDGGRKRGDLVAASILAGLATLAKVTGLAFVPALVMLIAAEKDRRAATISAITGLATASLLLVWGAAIDWHAFVVTTAQQGTRPIHFNIFLRWFDDGLINHSVIGRGWVLFLWIGTLATVLARPFRDTAALTVPLVLYTTAISIGSGNWTFGWYAVPLYPFLCLGAGRFLADTWKQPTLFRGAMLTLVCVLYSLNFTLDVHWAKQHEAWPVLRRVVSLVVAGFLTPYCLFQVWPTEGWKKLARASAVVGLATVVVLAGVFVVRYDTYYEEYRNFDRDVYFDR